jgi:heterodisulfide reductase subunit C
MNAAPAETTTVPPPATPPDNGMSFVEEIGHLLHAAKGNPINTCIQCGTCSATCPVASGGFMDNSPRRIIALIRSGFKDAVLKANTYWYCASCYQCTVRCPRNIDIAGLMYGLKRYSVWRATDKEDLIGPTFTETFVKMILRTGRSYEPVLATTYLFTYGLPEMIQEAQTATALMIKGRLPILPARIKRLDNFKRMIKHIIPMGDKE